MAADSVEVSNGPSRTKPVAGQLREPVVAVGFTPATLESAAEAGAGQFERV